MAAAAAAEASLLRFEGVLDAGFLGVLVDDGGRWEVEEVGRVVIESLVGRAVWAYKAGHKKGRLRSSRQEEDCL